ncbi:MAG: phosphotransferase, partial [Gammaproteobacteria bacterium]|nr:phosphotransferase [Gammaproteobacteria bacterium]
MPERLERIKHWLVEQGIQEFDIAPASADASFRRYFRATPADGSEPLIVMDAPPEHEDCKPFIHVAGMMLDMGLHVPRVLGQDLEQGFLLLSDLGSESYLSRLDRESVEGLYGDALDALVTLHRSHDPAISQLPPYNDLLY